jgi:hypothetical protein
MLRSDVQATVRPDGTIKPGAAGEAGRNVVAKAMDLIAGAIAFKVGGLPAAAGTYGAKVGQRAIMGGIGAASARRSFEGGRRGCWRPLPCCRSGSSRRVRGWRSGSSDLASGCENGGECSSRQEHGSGDRERSLAPRPSTRQDEGVNEGVGDDDTEPFAHQRSAE